MTAMWISVAGVEDRNHIFVSNRSMRNVMVNVRFDNGSNAEIKGYANIKVGPRSYASIGNNIEAGKVLVEIWIQGSEQKQHFELTIGTDRGLVALDNKDRWGVDIFESVYKSVNIPKGGSIATLYPAF
uniref:Uncharacterized protein n=2 Tax=Physcomitrium patens TaxID=3218 RepID=A0A2K1LBI1_PHYPA|nr:hypothetical protein PHYPA_001803 [Physcomitrium patens]